MKLFYDDDVDDCDKDDVTYHDYHEDNINPRNIELLFFVFFQMFFSTPPPPPNPGDIFQKIIRKSQRPQFVMFCRSSLIGSRQITDLFNYF